VSSDTQDPEIASTPLLNVTSFSGTDPNGSVEAYMITTTPDVPPADDPNWSTTAPGAYILPDETPEGYVTVYGWVKDNDGLVSPQPGTQKIFFQTTQPQVIDGPTVTLTYREATITWSTDIATVGKVNWGETANLEWTTPWESAPTTDHSITFPVPFKPDVTYQYQLANGPALENGYTFTSLSWGGEVALTLYVDVNTTVPAEEQDGTEAAPFDSIMKAATAIGDVSGLPGDEVQILVAPGTYNENVNLWDAGITLGDKWLKLIAIGGRDVTTILPTELGWQLRLITHSLVDGFDIQPALADSWWQSSPRAVSESAIINSRIHNVASGDPSCLTLWDVSGFYCGNVIFGPGASRAFVLNSSIDNLVIENCTFLSTGWVNVWGPHGASFGNMWLRNNFIYNQNGFNFGGHSMTGGHIYNNVFDGGDAIDYVDALDMQFYNNTLINAYIGNAGKAEAVFNNLIITTNNNRWKSDAAQYQVSTPTLTPDEDGRNLIAPSLDSVQGMFLSTDFYVMVPDPEDPEGGLIPSSERNPDYAKLDPAYRAEPRPAGAGFNEFLGFKAPATDIYGEAHADPVAIGACAARSVWPIPGDANGDCKVNILDLIYVRNRLNQNPDTGDNYMADVNEDGRINILDLIYVRNRLNTKCPE